VIMTDCFLWSSLFASSFFIFCNTNFLGSISCPSEFPFDILRLLKKKSLHTLLCTLLVLMFSVGHDGSFIVTRDTMKEFCNSRNLKTRTYEKVPTFVFWYIIVLKLVFMIIFFQRLSLSSFHNLHFQDRCL
jgi:hypothetical protein